MKDSDPESPLAIALELRESQLRGILATASEAIISTDEAQTIVLANHAAGELFRCRAEDLIGLPLAQLMPQRFRTDHHAQVAAFGAAESAARGMGVQREVVAVRADGQEFPIDAAISQAHVDGQRLYTVVLRDLTEPRRLAAALRSSELLTAATFNANSVAMAQVDPATCRFVVVNEALCRLSGHSAAELLAQDPGEPGPDAGSAEPFGALARAAGAGRQQKQLRRKDGGIVTVEVSGSTLRDADGGPPRWVCVVQDITARVQAEQRLRAREARQALLVRLNDRLRQLEDPQAIAYQAACLLGEFAGVERVGYAEDEGNGETIVVARNYTRDVPGIEGRYRYDDYGPQLLASLRAGHTVVRSDIAHDADLSPEERAAHARLQLGATVNVPLLRDSRLHAVFFVHAAQARAWLPDEVALFEEVAQRLRADVERARAGAEVRTAKAKLEAALASMTDSVYISDAAGNLVESNQAFATYHRFASAAQRPGTMAEYPEIFEVFTTEGARVPMDQWPVPRALRGEVASGIHYRMHRKDTGESWIASYSFAPIRADDGRIVGSVVSGRDVTPIERTRAELAASHLALQRLIANQQRVQEEERSRIARELHDDLQQSLAAIRMDAISAGERLPKDRHDIQALLARIDRLSLAAITSTRRIVGDLRPEMLEELGLAAALEALCSQHAERTGSACRLEVSPEAQAAPLDQPMLSVGLYRILQEALNNVAKHAGARNVKVRLDCAPDDLLLLRVEDDGIGFRLGDRRSSASFGLRSMAERVRSLGGQLRIEAEPKRGTTIEVLVPILGPGPEPPLLAGDWQAEPVGGPTRARVTGDSNGWGHPLQTVIDALSSNVAVLERSGVIRYVNRAWREFAREHGDPRLLGCGTGINYLTVCRHSALSLPLAGTVLEGLAEVLEDRKASFLIEYPCDTPDRKRWFRMHAASITGGLTIVTHVEINAPGPGSTAKHPN